MKESYKIEYLESITEVEKVLLLNIVDILKKRDFLVSDIQRNANDYNKVIKYANDLNALCGPYSRLKDLKQQLWEYGSVSTLTVIANQDKFKDVYSDDILIPIEVLPSFSMYDKLPANDPKAGILKLLGGTVTA